HHKHIKGFYSYVLVAPGRPDWKQKIEQERGSLMEAFVQTSAKSKRDHYMVSASNVPPPESDTEKTEIHEAIKILILPQFIYIDSVNQTVVPGLRQQDPNQHHWRADNTTMYARLCDSTMLSQAARRALIKRELERHLRPLGLDRDAEDSRPGGAGVFFFVSHVGGHKFLANVLIYRKQQQQMIWLARVRPEHCEEIVKHTILGGNVVHPETQLRGEFDRLRDLTGW
ncbi:hypothetical protein N7539_009295, partial [Penicillium diatomitis]